MKSRTWVAPVAIGLAVAATLSGCSSAGSKPAVTQNSKAPITIWVDDSRTEPAKAYAKAHPELKATIVTVDNTPGAEPSKVALAVKAGKGIPDVVFLSQPDEISSLLVNPVNYPLALNGVVKDSVLKGFASGTVERCTYDGKAYCLPNDLAQTVLFYNKTLFEKWGYTVPTTFDDWLALGKKVAADHPGYSLGSVNGRYGLDAYFASSQCDFNTATSATEVKIDLSSENCTRVADVMGPLLQNGTLSSLDPFSTQFTALTKSGKLLATISPVWMGKYGIEPTATEKGNWAVAAMPTWSGASTNYSGAVGGGIWTVSARSANQAAAIAFAEGMTTDTTVQGTASGYPADTASASIWLKDLANDSWWAENPASAYEDAAGKVSTTLGYVRYEATLNDLYNSTILASKGDGIADALQTFGTKTTSAAEAAGYTVSK